MTSHASPLDQQDLTLLLFGHAAFQYLRAGAELGLFEKLEQQPGLDRSELRTALGLEDRALDILLLGTTALRLIEHSDAGYRNSARISEVFAEGRWDTLQAVIGFEAYVAYAGLVDFTESLRANTNIGLRRIPGTGEDLYRRLPDNPAMNEVFYHYMHTWSELAHGYLVEKVDFTTVSRLLDVGGGDAVNAIALARAFPLLAVTVLELPSVAPLARKRVDEAGLGDRIEVIETDMFAEPFPRDHDGVLFAHQLQIWTPEQNTALLRSAHQALPDGGKVVIINSMSDDTGDGPLMAALDSAYFAALAAGGGMIYPWRQHEESLRQAGFTRTERIPCAGSWTPHGILVATK
jgi:L-tyrosine C(3)-methyltransferase